MYFDYYFLGIILIPAILFSLYAEISVSSNFKEYSQEFSQKGIRACDLIRGILNNAGLHYISISQINGDALNNYYNHSTKNIGLSSAVYSSSSIAALGIACHEAGHALQYADGYAPIKIRNILVPACNLVSKIVWPIIFVGLFLNFANTNTALGRFLLYAGVIFFGLTVLVNLVTLPSEYDASNRAIKMLEQYNILQEEELCGAKKVLRSAALTYVAALLVSLLNLIRFLLVFRRRD